MCNEASATACSVESRRHSAALANVETVDVKIKFRCSLHLRHKQRDLLHLISPWFYATNSPAHVPPQQLESFKRLLKKSEPGCCG